jgi:hypothetical protein
MTGALDEVQASTRQGACEAAGGIDGNHGVLRVGEDENRRLDGRDNALQLAELAQQGAAISGRRALRCRGGQDSLQRPHPDGSHPRHGPDCGGTGAFRPKSGAIQQRCDRSRRATVAGNGPHGRTKEDARPLTCLVRGKMSTSLRCGGLARGSTGWLSTSSR